MKACVIVFPGSNCDRDIAVALHSASGKWPRMIWHQETRLPTCDLIVVPGGFSHGDYLRAGAIAARGAVMREVATRARAGTPVLGICNGFQILTECGLLPGALIRNIHLRFICRHVFLKITATDNIFTAPYRSGQVISLPIAHQEGLYYAKTEILNRLEGEDRIALRYCNFEGKMRVADNPNGSQHHIAGILNENRNILGMMPHPERAADPMLGHQEGKNLFESLATTLG